jgi:hypothetical protein
MKPALPPYSPFEWRIMAFVAWLMSLASIMTWFIGSFPLGVILAALILTFIAWRANRKVTK